MHIAIRRLGLAVALAFLTAGAAWADPSGAPDAQMLTLRYEFGGDRPQQLFANGVPLTAAPSPVLREKESPGWGVGAGTVIVALGVALAVIVLAAGHSADQLNDKNENGEAGCDGAGCALPGG